LEDRKRAYHDLGWNPGNKNKKTGLEFRGWCVDVLMRWCVDVLRCPRVDVLMRWCDWLRPHETATRSVCSVFVNCAQQGTKCPQQRAFGNSVWVWGGLFLTNEMVGKGIALTHTTTPPPKNSELSWFGNGVIFPISTLWMPA
jgi:hypothetical protein